MIRFLLLFLIVQMVSCDGPEKKLPIIGQQEKLPNGEIKYHKIPDFAFTNQLGETVTQETLSNSVYVADFFFTSCPSICPKVMKQMLRVYEHADGNEKIKFVSHTIDPKRDTQQTLYTYASNLGVDHDRWHFLTGDGDALLDMADSYYVAAFRDDDVPGGFDHSGKLLLIDAKGHIRAFCDGTDPDDVDDFIKDVDVLMKEYEE